MRSEDVSSPSRRLDPEAITSRICVVRSTKVLLDSDLAHLYGVSTKRLNEQVRRNPARFPSEFMFQLTDQEFSRLRSQFATSNARTGRGGRRYSPFAFTEHGALMAAYLLATVRAIEVSVFVVRAFVRLRETLAAHKDLATKLSELEKKTEALALRHDALARETHARFKEVLEALRQLMAAPPTNPRPIGFIGPK